MNNVLKFALISALIFGGLTSSNAQVLENTPPLDGFYEKANTKGRAPRAYAHVREADVWRNSRVWRVIDFRQTMNQYLYYPISPVQDRLSLMTVIEQGFKNGKFIAYDAITDDFTKPLTYEEFLKQNTTIRTIEKEDLDNPGLTIQSNDTSVFKTENVKMLRLKEDWFVDKQRGIMDVRIIGMAPIIQVFDDATGEFKGTSVLFWLYYDHVRPEFAMVEAFNRHNSAMRMSYDDVFAWNRFWDSNITKMDNEKDRSIQEYLTGDKILLKAEELKQKISDMESDLWEY